MINLENLYSLKKLLYFFIILLFLRTRNRLPRDDRKRYGPLVMAHGDSTAEIEFEFLPQWGLERGSLCPQCDALQTELTSLSLSFYIVNPNVLIKNSIFSINSVYIYFLFTIKYERNFFTKLSAVTLI